MNSRRIAASLLAWLWLAPATSAQVDDSSREAVMARFAAGATAMESGQFPAAETEYRAVLELVPDLSEARANLGLVLFLQGKFADSVSELERVASEKPELSPRTSFSVWGTSSSARRQEQYRLWSGAWRIARRIWRPGGLWPRAIWRRVTTLGRSASSRRRSPMNRTRPGLGSAWGGIT